jgi:D-beta-D-heptose 7-phosphate kinase / D-beta-D-heptose 1-phosphate adenosyltransferase
LVGRTAGRHGQQILRVDRESRERVSEQVEAKLLAAALAALGHVRAVLISDYGKGVCTSELLAAVICAARERHLLVLVDPRRGADYDNYRGATLIKPNRHEAGQATNREIGTIDEAFAAGRELCVRCDCHAAVITLDADGIVLVTRDGVERHFATRDRQVADVTGAGDTVLAVLGVSLAAGIDLEHACELANAAAGLQVERVGVSSVTWDEINSVGNILPMPPFAQRKATKKDRLQIAHAYLARPSSPARRSANVHYAIDSHRSCGQRIVFTNGCFDLLHAGHVHSLITAKTMGDVLVVGLNSDASVRRLKGESRPIVAQSHRAAMLAALACVDYVVIFDEETPERLIAELRPDVLVKGDESPPEHIPGASIVASYGGRVELVPLLPGISTTALIERLRAASPTKRSDGALLPLALHPQADTRGRGEGGANCPSPGALGGVSSG